MPMSDAELRNNILNQLDPEGPEAAYFRYLCGMEDTQLSEKPVYEPNEDAYRFTALEHAGKTGWSNPDAVITAAEMYLTFLKGGSSTNLETEPNG